MRSCLSNFEWLANLTQIQIPSDVQHVLALGEKFSPEEELKKDNIIDIIANVESASFTLPVNDIKRLTTLQQTNCTTI